MKKHIDDWLYENMKSQMLEKELDDDWAILIDQQSKEIFVDVLAIQRLKTSAQSNNYQGLSPPVKKKSLDLTSFEHDLPTWDIGQ